MPSLRKPGASTLTPVAEPVLDPDRMPSTPKDADREHVGPAGPFLEGLSGYDKHRSVPTFDANGRRSEPA